jgi:hypothetical protein
MLLVDVDTVRDRIGYADLPDNNQATYSAISRATLWLEGYLRAEFPKKARTPIWQYDMPTLDGRNTGLRCKLPGGFVRSSPVPSIVTAAAINGFSSGVVMDPANYRLDYEKGLLTITDASLSVGFLQVSYESGFNVSSVDDSLYLESEIPDWLWEACVLKATHTILVDPATGKPDTPSVSVEQTKADLDTLLVGKIRYFPNADLPLIE